MKRILQVLTAGGMAGYLSGAVVPRPWAYVVAGLGSVIIGVVYALWPHKHRWQHTEAFEHTYLHECRCGEIRMGAL